MTRREGLDWMTRRGVSLGCAEEDFTQWSKCTSEINVVTLQKLVEIIPE